MRVSRALAAVLCVASAGACGGTASASDTGATSFTLGFVNGADSDFHTCLERAVTREAEAEGVKLTTMNSEQSKSAEKAAVAQLITQGVDAIILQTVDVPTLTDDIAQARAARVPIFLTSVANDDLSGILGAVTVDLYQVGGLDAGWVSNDAVGAPAEAAVIAGAPGAASDRMVAGFTGALPPNVKVVANEPAGYDRAQARTVAAGMIKAHPDIAYAFVANEEMAFGALDAFRAAAKAVKIVTVNGTDAGLAAVSDGRFAATVANSPDDLGRKAVQNTTSLLRHEHVDAVTSIPPSLITKNEVRDAPRYCQPG
jgi:ribose transport system substrate-binding protein